MGDQSIILSFACWQVVWPTLWFDLHYGLTYIMGCRKLLFDLHYGLTYIMAWPTSQFDLHYGLTYIMVWFHLHYGLTYIMIWPTSWHSVWFVSLCFQIPLLQWHTSVRHSPPGLPAGGRRTVCQTLPSWCSHTQSKFGKQWWAVMAAYNSQPLKCCEILVILTHWGRDKMAAISHTTFSRVFSTVKNFEIWIKFHWNMFLRV